SERAFDATSYDDDILIDDGEDWGDEDDAEVAPDMEEGQEQDKRVMGSVSQCNKTISNSQNLKRQPKIKKQLAHKKILYLKTTRLVDFFKKISVKCLFPTKKIYSLVFSFFFVFSSIYCIILTSDFMLNYAKICVYKKVQNLDIVPIFNFVQNTTFLTKVYR
ncbi:hypothetical protein RFI_30855, partial [Reticulomyxa filosa]